MILDGKIYSNGNRSRGCNLDSFDHLIFMGPYGLMTGIPAFLIVAGGAVLIDLIRGGKIILKKIDAADESRSFMKMEAQDVNSKSKTSSESGNPNRPQEIISNPPTIQIFCAECGATVQSSTEFCAACGNPIGK